MPSTSSSPPLSDRRFFWIVSAITIGLAILPHLIGLALTPRGALFYGNRLTAPGDFSIYYSYIEQGRQGRFFMFDAFTSESHAATLFQPLWTIVGLLAVALHLSTPVAFALARLAAAPVLLLTLWWVVRWLWPDDRWRQRVGFLASIVASGLGGLVMIIWPAGTGGNIFRFPDLWVSEAYPMLTLWSSAHFILVTSGLLFVLVAVERSWLEQRWSWIGWAGLVALGVLAIHPFHLITWVTLWVLLTGWRLWSAKRRVWGYIARWLAVVAITSPVLLLYGLQLLFDPLSIGRAVQNLNPSGSPFVWLVAIGGWLAGAVTGVWLWRPRDERWRWVVALMLAYVLVLYAPVVFQRRLSQGLILPFVWLSIPVVALIWGRLRPRLRLAWKPFTVACLFFASSSWLVVGGLVIKDYLDDLVVPKRMYFVDAEYQGVARFLRSTDPHQPVMTTMLEGNVLAGLTAHQMFLGYAVETLDFQVKRDLMRQFYSTMPVTDQRQTLQQWQLCYVMDSARTQAYGSAFQPRAWPDLVRVWSGPTLTLYRTPYCR